MGSHRFAMFLALFGGVAGPPDASLRLLERLHESFRILLADTRRQPPDAGGPVNFVVGFGRNLVYGPISRHQDQDDFWGMLLQESGEMSDGVTSLGRDRLDEEQDWATSCDDGRLIFRRAPRTVVDPEPEGAMFVREPLPVHLKADGGLELRPAPMAGTAGHRPPPSIAAMTALANAEDRTSLPRGSSRAGTF